VLIGTITATMLAGHAWAAKPKPKPKPPASFTLQWVGDMALSTERGLPAGGFLGAVMRCAATWAVPI
jgi:hypothetical protein